MAEGTIIFRGDFGYGVAAGRFDSDAGESIDVRILRVMDASGVAVEIVLPVPNAEDMARMLLGTKVVVPSAADVAAIGG